MKRIVSIFIALAMLLGMTACGAKEHINLVGTWEAEVNYAGIVNAIVSENEVLSISGATLDSAPIKVTYTFGEDGTASCEWNKTALNDKLMVLFKEILEPMVTMLGSSSVEDYIAKSGQTDEELIRSLFTDETYDSIVNTASFEGTYTIKKDELTVTVNGHTEQSKVTLEGDTLTLKAPVATTTTSDVQKAAVQALFPMDLKKVG